MKPAIVLIAILLAGCAEYGAVKSGVQTHGAMAADEALEVAKWQTCQAASIGSLERELGGDRERIAGWILWCGKKPGNSPLIATPPLTVQPQGGFTRDEGVKRAIW